MVSKRMLEVYKYFKIIPPETIPKPSRGIALAINNAIAELTYTEALEINVRELYDEIYPNKFDRLKPRSRISAIMLAVRKWNKTNPKNKVIVKLRDCQKNNPMAWIYLEDKADEQTI